MSPYVDAVMKEYLSIRDARQGIAFLLQKVVEAGKANNVDDARELCGIGHVILEKAGVRRESDAFVKLATKLRIYCWICDKVIVGPESTYAVEWCRACQKTFCPSHAKKKLLGGRECPLCRVAL